MNVHNIQPSPLSRTRIFRLARLASRRGTYSDHCCSRKSAGSCMFCSKVWSTPDQIAFQGHSSGMRATILPITAASGCESLPRHAAGIMRPTSTPTSKTTINSNTFFIIMSPVALFHLNVETRQNAYVIETHSQRLLRELHRRLWWVISCWMVD